jgi:hypothetical protein
VPWPSKLLAITPATQMAWGSVPTGALRVESASVDWLETRPISSEPDPSTPVSTTATVIPAPLAPAVKAASAWMAPRP